MAASEMRAMVMARSPGGLELRQVPVPDPGEDQILVKVHACGVCRTDLQVIDGELAAPKLPLVPFASVEAGFDNCPQPER